MNVSILDVAKYILIKLESTSSWKLQKLCYYAQAWSLAWQEKPLFEEDFEAWINGPVSPELFKKHKGQFTITAGSFDFGNIDHLNDDQKETIDLVIKEYGDKEAYWLREQTHQEYPYKNAREGLSEGEPSNNIITKESMGLYYGGL